MAFNKMFVMLPVMFAARKLDGEDPMVVNYLRIAYGVMQGLCVLVVLYTYLKATAAAAQYTNHIVYVPPAPTPFQDPNATKKKYTETNYGAHVLSAARSLLGSTLFGVCMTVGLHIYKGMVVGLAIQTVMGPLNLAENPLIKALLLGTGKIDPADKLFDEKSASELTPDDEVVDESGNPLVRNNISALSNSATGKKTAAAKKDSGKEGETASTMMTLEEVMLDTWDSGDSADISNLMSALTEQNCNTQSSDDKWTPLMVLAGLGAVKGTASAIRQAIQLGANPAMTDKEGWSALHWAAFHGSPEAARELVKDISLLDATDKEGLTPLEIAKKENNNVVVKVLEEAEAAAEKSEDADGLRKRK
ncbi:Phosphate transport (Pho88) [Seminavis robusta]|uniref:Phosphate transport (Pho88) n=1 Tax=Seminavis robusta TaxID=568900 RepID=A0A9N8DJF7_9STRA|nr:Phosphate transport (Pho88) [Seminavis robusta]|eukprot:Sro175_g076930.1 Phosphate transport (Pho88) (362) ;mRNA; r:17710-19127